MIVVVVVVTGRKVVVIVMGSDSCGDGRYWLEGGGSFSAGGNSDG